MNSRAVAVRIIACSDRNDRPERPAKTSGVPGFPGNYEIVLTMTAAAGPEPGFFQETALDRPLTMDKQQHPARMRADCRRIMDRAADAVNAAPAGNVIGGSEMEVKDLMAEWRCKAFETAVHMRKRRSPPSRSPPWPRLPN
jgi:hypothetical protein